MKESIYSFFMSIMCPFHDYIFIIQFTIKSSYTSHLLWILQETTRNDIYITQALNSLAKPFALNIIRLVTKLGPFLRS